MVVHDIKLSPGFAKVSAAEAMADIPDDVAIESSPPYSTAIFSWSNDNVGLESLEYIYPSSFPENNPAP